ncbi:MAG: glycerate kinase [Planctomycetes bacterium]|nr:glycerate kinase [Planctomycetota bacterium]
MAMSLRKHAREIFHAGLRAVEPDVCIKNHLQLTGNMLKEGERFYNLDAYKNIYVIGFGKASGYMAVALEEMLNERITSGVVNVRYGYSAPCRIVKVNQAGHPLPDVAGMQGTREILRLVNNVGENDLVFCLISGGGSALFELPCNGITLEELRQTTELLLKCGARIDEINTIRKHISQVKGGRLAKLCRGEIVSLVLSDVVNDPLDAIASGPTASDNTVFSHCERILAKYRISPKIPLSVKKHIHNGLEGKAEETPKETDAAFHKVQHVIIGNVGTALRAAAEKAKALGYHTSIHSSSIEGEAREAAKIFGAMAREIHASGNPAKRPACIIAGGETTVTMQRHGLGGRNQEFTLSAALEIDGLANTVILSAGTDGTDGNTDAAGAVADGLTIARAKELRIDPEAHLSGHNAYDFFKSQNSLVMTGPTKTNVMDIVVLLVG